MLKQMIILRNDLNMRKGKMVAQGSHAVVAAILKRAFKRVLTALVPTDGITVPQEIECLCIPLTPDIKAWLEGEFTKVCARAETEEELLTLYTKAQDAGIRAALIRDSGHTEFKMQPTNTAIAIGPDLITKIDPITSHLKLL